MSDKLKLILFSNNINFINTAFYSGIDTILIDLETVGKTERQKGYHLEINNHRLDDIRMIRNTYRDIEIICRVDPVNKHQIRTAIEYGANYIMLPMFTTLNEVDLLLKYVNKDAKIILLLETKESIKLLDELKKFPIEEYMLGLNDLRISYNKKFNFEFLLDDFIDNIRKKIIDKPFGFGGITILDKGSPLPAKNIIQELARLNASLTIVRRAFKSDIQDKDMQNEIRRIQSYYKKMLKRPLQKINDDRRHTSKLIKNIVEKING